MTPLEPEAITATVSAVFSSFKPVLDLRLRNVTVEDGWLMVHFDGQEGDQGGPYGARILLPESVGDNTWRAYEETDSLREWCTYGVYIRIMEEYETGRHEGHVHHQDGIWWLITDGM